MSIGDVIVGRTAGKRPTAPQADLFGGMDKAMKTYGRPSFGEGQSRQALDMMKGRLGGYTSQENAALFGKGFGKIAGQQGQAANTAGYGMAKAGIGGGMAADAQRRIGESAQEKIADVGTDLTIQNIQEKAKRLAEFAKQSGDVNAMEMARRAFAGQLSIAELQAAMDKYSADMSAYAAERGDESGGIPGAVLDYYTGGVGGDIWKDLKRG